MFGGQITIGPLFISTGGSGVTLTNILVFLVIVLSFIKFKVEIKLIIFLFFTKF